MYKFVIDILEDIVEAHYSLEPHQYGTTEENDLLRLEGGKKKMKKYKFKGYDWMELAECWGIEVGYTEWTTTFLGGDNEEKKLLSEVFEPFPETIDVTYYVNNTEFTVTTSDSDEVYMEKIKRYISSRMDNQEELEEMTKDIRRFLQALYKESKEVDYNYPVYEGMLNIKDDFTLCQWVLKSLSKLWT